LVEHGQSGRQPEHWRRIMKQRKGVTEKKLRITEKRRRLMEQRGRLMEKRRSGT
jgi:hypothetical protein